MFSSGGTSYNLYSFPFLQTLDMQRDTICLKRAVDDRLTNVSFETLLSHLSVRNLLQVYASILLERRVIFTAKCLG